MYSAKNKLKIHFYAKAEKTWAENSEAVSSQSWNDLDWKFSKLKNPRLNGPGWKFWGWKILGWKGPSPLAIHYHRYYWLWTFLLLSVYRDF